MRSETATKYVIKITAFWQPELRDSESMDDIMSEPRMG